jgi:MoxR-like ATPase
VVEVVRASRNHPAVRIGSSVRGAIDLVLLAGELVGLRGTRSDDYSTGLDAALAALSGRLRVFEGGEHQADDIVRALWAGVFGPPPDAGEGDPGKG